MYLTQTSIKSILNAAHTPDEKPIQVVGDKEQREFLEKWCKDIERAKNACTAQVVRSTYAKPQTTLDARVDFPVASGGYSASYYSASQHIRVKFVDDMLRLTIGYSNVIDLPLANLDQFWHVVDGIKKKMAEKAAQEQKRKKIRELKTRSVEAQVEDLAQRLQFAYQLTRKHTKVVLTVQLDGQRSLFVDIPLGKIQETIERLESLIQQVRSLYAEGLRFKIAQSPYGHFHQPKPAE